MKLVKIRQRKECFLCGKVKLTNTYNLHLVKNLGYVCCLKCFKYLYKRHPTEEKRKIAEKIEKWKDRINTAETIANL